MKSPLFLTFFLLSLLTSRVLAEGKPPNGSEALRVQIYLDQKCFGPGFLDGKPGNFTSNAVYAYNRAQGRSPGDWAALVTEAQDAITDLYAMATVPTFAKKFVDPSLPTNKEQQAKRKMLTYRSYLEFMAERYHTSESYLIELNGKKKAYGARPRSLLKVPNIEPFQIENLRVGRSYPKDETLSNRTVIIDTRNKGIFIYDPNLSPPETNASSLLVVVATPDDGPEELGALVAMFPTTPGKERFIHRGTWKIVNAVELPEWRYDKSLLTTGKRSKKSLQIPPGPNNPVGIMWNGLSKSGIGIHGTSSPRTIGRSRSSGCYRLANWDIARFPNFARIGARVIVR